MIVTTITKLGPIAGEALDCLSALDVLPWTTSPWTSHQRAFEGKTPADLHTAIREALSSREVSDDYRAALQTVLAKLAYYITCVDVARARSDSWFETDEVRTFGHVTMTPFAAHHGVTVIANTLATN